MHNTLTDPVIRIVAADRDEHVTLPGLYAALMTDQVRSVTALRPHQRHALHAFLVQVGALALLAADTTTLTDSGDVWRDLLRGLTREFPSDEPWTLVVGDLSKPALLQPPVPEATLDALKIETTPDSIDMLATARNHELKVARMSSAEMEPDSWLYALLTLQTCEGWGGRNNYGISRMNSGSGSRPAVGLAPKGGWGARVRRDISRLIAKRGDVLADFPIYRQAGGIALVWLEPWNGVTQITSEQLDPYYVEVCRRIRLVAAESGAILARRGGSTATRIAKVAAGVTGDPWAPIKKQDGFKLLTITGSGWDYSCVAKILDPEKFKAAPLQVWEPDDGIDVSLVMMGMARGNSTTDGYHERVVPIPPRLVSLFGGKTDRLGTACRERVQQASRMRLKVLKPALYKLAQAAPAKIDFDKSQSQKSADPILKAFDREVDRTFFTALFDELAETGDAARAQRQTWVQQMYAVAELMLRQAEASAPMPQARRHKIIAAGREQLAAAYHATFPTNGDADADL